MKKKKAFIFLLVILCFVSLLPEKLSAMSRKPKVFMVTLKVDFGPAGKPGFTDEKFYVEKNTTPKEAVSQVYPILSGRVCCSLHDLLAIDGVKIDPAKNRWWICKVNGSTKVSPQKKKLKEGDIVEWIYAQDEQ